MTRATVKILKCILPYQLEKQNYSRPSASVSQVDEAIDESQDIIDVDQVGKYPAILCRQGLDWLR